MDVTIRFTGLCAFVEVPGMPPEMRVVMVDGRRKLPNSEYMHITPILRFRREDLDDQSPRQPDLTRDGQPVPLLDSFCFLSREDLVIQAPGAPGLSIVRRDPTTFPSREEPSDANRDDWHWVPDLNAIKPGAGVPDATWFQMPSPPPHIPIVARMTLRQGTLSTFEFLRRYPQSPPAPSPVDVYAFNGFRRAMAAFIECRFRCDSLTVASTDWDGGDQDLVFQQKDRIEIEVWNTPFFDVMDNIFPGNCWTKWFGFGHAFRHFYRLTSNVLNGHPFPGLNNVQNSAGDLVNFTDGKGAGCSPTKTLPLVLQPLEDRQQPRSASERSETRKPIRGRNRKGEGK